jgi:hypothetical protein
VLTGTTENAPTEAPIGMSALLELEAEDALVSAWRPLPAAGDEPAPELPCRRSASAEAAAIKLAEREQQ